MICDHTKPKIVAEKARETFNNIKKLNKESAKFTKNQRDELATKIKEEKDKWWDEVKDLMRRPHVQQQRRNYE
jgi:gas vesicle protein